MGDEVNGTAGDNTSPEQERDLASDPVKYVKAGLPEAQAETIAEWCNRSGVTLGALLEAFADLIEQYGYDLTPTLVLGRSSEVLDRARAITRQRKERR